MNNPFVVECAESFASRLETEVASNDHARVSRGWQLALGHTPSDSEMADGVAFLFCTLPHEQNGTEAEREFESKQYAELRHQRLVQFCQALLCSNPFLYVE